MFKRRKHRIEQFPETAGASGFGAPLGVSYEFRELPGSGARQYAYDTLALPMYTPIGWGVANKQSFDAYGSPIVGWEQTVGVESLIYNGNYTGQVTSTPLFNTDSNDNSDMVVSAFADSYSLPS